MNNRKNFIAFNFQCDTADVNWFSHLLSDLPVFRTVEEPRLELKEVDGITYVNADGQVINLARSTGTDRENEKGIRESFLSQGINTDFVPPICLDTGELIDGYTRHGVIVGLGATKFVYLVVKLKDGFTIDDAIDEIGLGRNLHPQAKKATMSDYKKRLTNFVVRSEESTGEKFTLNQGIQWFNGVPNNFSESEIETATSDVIKKIRSLENMESFTKSDAEKKSSSLLNMPKKDIVALNSSSSTYMDRGVTEIINYFEQNGTVPSVVGFLNKVEADDAESERKKIFSRIKKMNKTFIRLMNEYIKADKEDRDFDLIKFEGFLPQIIGKENNIVKDY